MAYKKKIKTLFNILLTKRREMRMMQMLNEHAHKNRREAGVMPKIINNLEENILSAARRLVAEQGYAAVTMRAIAKECGIAVGTFYNYYPSKDAMLAACLLHDWQTALVPVYLRELGRGAASVFTIHTIENQGKGPPRRKARKRRSGRSLMPSAPFRSRTAASFRTRARALPPLERCKAATRSSERRSLRCSKRRAAAFPMRRMPLFLRSSPPRAY